MKPQAKPRPQPNPQWAHTPPTTSRDGRSVRIDLMQYGAVCEMYEMAKVPKVPGDGR